MAWKGRSGWERASSLGHVPSVNQELVERQLADWGFIIEPGELNVPEAMVFDVRDMTSNLELPNHMVAIDGSNQEIPVSDDYPATRICLVQIATVLVDLRTLLSQNIERFVDPRIVSQSVDTDVYNKFFPGANVDTNGCDTVAHSWRHQIFHEFRDVVPMQGDDACPSLLELYWELSELSGRITDERITISRCPDLDCDERNIQIPIEGCECEECGAMLFPTDALRVWEQVVDEGRNDGPTGVYRSIVEHLTMIAIIQTLRVRTPNLLGSMCFLMDGPLALFMKPAWLSTGLRQYLRQLNDDLIENGFRTPLVIGIQKTGVFNQHFKHISDQVPNEHLFCPTNDYIYEHIKTVGRNNGVYGENTHYGHLFCYKSETGQRFVFSLPPFTQVISLNGKTHFRMLNSQEHVIC